MTAQKKFVLLIFGMVLPYMAFVMYFALSMPSGTARLPMWFAYFGMSYFLLCTVVAAVIGRKWFRNTVTTPLTKKQSILARIGELWVLYLVIVWTGLFIYGVRDVISGELPLGRAIPGGLFLLAFIGIFSWSLHRSFQARKGKV